MVPGGGRTVNPLRYHQPTLNPAPDGALAVAQTLGPYTLGQPLVTLPFGELIYLDPAYVGTDADELSRPDG